MATEPPDRVPEYVASRLVIVVPDSRDVELQLLASLESVFSHFEQCHAGLPDGLPWPVIAARAACWCFEKYGTPRGVDFGKSAADV